MARTYKDNHSSKGRKGKRNDRGDNRGRRWASEDDNQQYGRARRHDVRKRKFDWESGENLD